MNLTGSINNNIANTSSNNNNSPVVIKVALKDDLRRFTMEQTSFTVLLNNIAAHFNIGSNVSELFVLKYADDEGDLITLSSDVEFSEAVRLARSKNANLKIFLTDRVTCASQADEAMPCVTNSQPTTSAPNSQPQDWRKRKVDCKLRKREKKAEKSLLRAQLAKAKQQGDQQATEKLHKELKDWKQNWRAEKDTLKKSFKKGAFRGKRGGHWQHHHHENHSHDEHHDHHHHHGGDMKLRPGKGRFVKHVSIPDGTEMSAGQQFVKVWKFRNELNEPWSSDTQLRWIGGDRLGAPDFVAVQQVNPVSEVDISITLIAPNKPGRYIAYFRLCAGDTKFGQRVWVQISVSDSSGSEKEDKLVASTDEDTVKYAHQLKLLVEMSFNDVSLNVRLLKKFDGDLQQVVQRLLKRQQVRGFFMP